MTTLDWTVLSTYFAGVLLLGVWLARRQKSTEDYFLGGIRADVYSDAIQFAVLWAGTVAAMFVALGLIGDFSEAVSPARARLVLSRLLTVLWGAFCLGAGLVLARSSRTIIELVNMVGSAFYGPMLSVFAAGILCRRIRERDMFCGLLAGVAANLVLWRWAPGVSWLWWNPAGFLAAVLTALAMDLLPLRSRGQALSGRGAAGLPGIEEPPSGQIHSGLHWRGSRRAVLALALYFALIVCVAVVLQEFLLRPHP